ncbi:NADH:ubiquinone oxidoreductase subunit NDUFA12 [Marivita sp. S2033]|uniref:NADH:ubiquinone oxidoreductase subunit NDUFA12 n=1 Tax=Marivita sp. S2033 TaxID=3373187 RepID=UPI003982389E
MGIMNSLLRAVTWWNGQTYGTQFYTWRKGNKVGEDSQGNIFYQSKDGVRRWVIYNGEIEASRVDANWHGWLHHTFDELPSERPLPQQPWIKPHQENLTGTALAYAPDGSIRRPVPADRRDYEAWSPE